MADSWDPTDRIESFVDALADAFESDLVSVFLYGSLARGEAVEDVSDVNLLVLLKEAGTDQLLRGAGLVREWAEDTGGVPLVLTPQEWRRSVDVFPLIIADMQQAHRQVWGADPLNGMGISLRNLRLEAEREVRAELIHFREGVLLAGRDAEALGAHLQEAAPSIATYLRAVLHLARRPLPGSTPEVARQAANIVGGDISGFLRVWEGRHRGDDFTAEPETTESCYTLLEATARYVDTLADR